MARRGLHNEVSETLKDRLNGKIEIERHNGSIDVAADTYHRRISRFLNRYLASAATLN